MCFECLPSTRCHEARVAQVSRSLILGLVRCIAALLSQQLAAVGFAAAGHQSECRAIVSRRDRGNGILLITSSFPRTLQYRGAARFKGSSTFVTTYSYPVYSNVVDSEDSTES